MLYQKRDSISLQALCLARIFNIAMTMISALLFLSTPLAAETNKSPSNDSYTPPFLSTPTLAPSENSSLEISSNPENSTFSPTPESTNLSSNADLAPIPSATNNFLGVSNSTISLIEPLSSNNTSLSHATNLLPNTWPSTQGVDPDPTTTTKEALTQKTQNNSNIAFSTKDITKTGEQIKSSVVAKNAPPLTISNCITTALEKNPLIRQSIDTIRVQSGNFINVRAAMLPHLGITNSSFEWIDPNINNKNQLPSNEVPINQTWTITLGASQLLYNGGTAQANAKAAKFGEYIAYYNLQNTINNVVANVYSSFYKVILDRSLIVANQQSIEVLASNLADQKSRFEAGTVPRFNVLQAEVQLANAQPELITARNNFRIDLFQLVQLIGIDYPNLQSVEVPFQVVGSLEYRPRKIDSGASIYTALQRNPILKAQRQNILIMAQNITSALGGFLPTVTATGGYQYLSYDGGLTQGANGNNVTYNHNLGNFVSGWFFGVQGNWAIFDGLATYGNVKQAKANLMYAKTSYDNQVRQTILSVQQSISNMQQAKETVDSQKANVMQAAEALRLAQERLNTGAGVQLDVLNAQVQLLSAQSAVLQSEYNYISSTAKYDETLSVTTEYESLFHDPMNDREKARFCKLNSSYFLQPELPRALRARDPLPAAFVQKKGLSIKKRPPSSQKKTATQKIFFRNDH